MFKGMLKRKLEKEYLPYKTLLKKCWGTLKKIKQKNRTNEKYSHWNETSIDILKRLERQIRNYPECSTEDKKKKENIS